MAFDWINQLVGFGQAYSGRIHLIPLLYSVHFEENRPLSNYILDSNLPSVVNLSSCQTLPQCVPKIFQAMGPSLKVVKTF